MDRLPDRLEMARRQGAATINFDEEDLVGTVRELTRGDGAARVIDVVGVDAQHAHHGPNAPGLLGKAKDAVERMLIEPGARTHGRGFVAGDGPAQVHDWAIDCVAKCGTVAIVGVYPPTDRIFPIGIAMNKNLTIRMGNANHRRYYDVLIEHVMAGRLDPTRILSHVEPLTGVLDAYKAFDVRQPGWLKVELKPSA